MKFLEHLEYLTETKINSFRIGYGIRDTKTHELIKGFHNLHFYKELSEFKSENAWQKSWKITNELDVDDKRKFTFWGDENTVYDVPKDEPTKYKTKFGENLYKTAY